ncbi:hypothetical protein K661_03263, partial [Piscirickettsia salmonis LF-89 = ATCC VR-1361]
TRYACYRTNGLSQLRSAKNPNLPRPTHPVLSTPWLAAIVQVRRTSRTMKMMTSNLPITSGRLEEQSDHQQKGVHSLIMNNTHQEKIAISTMMMTTISNKHICAHLV